MQQGKYVAAVLVVFLLMTLLFAGLAKRSGSSQKMSGGFSDEAVTNYPFAQLTEKEKDLYRTLCKGISACKEQIRLPATYSAAEYEKIYLMVGMQQPEFFYLDQVYELRDFMNSVTIRYRMTKDQIEEARREISERTSLILNAIPENADDFEKLLFIHDAIAQACTYSSGSDSDTICGVMLNGCAQCEGYAKTLLYLAKSAGLNAMCVTGLSGRGVLHVWNIVQIGSNYYNVDVTWDDAPAYGGRFVHSCLAVPDCDFSDHITDEQYFNVPACIGYDANYYTRRGTVLTQENELIAAVLQQMRSGAENAVAEVRCSGELLFQRIRWALQNDPGTRERLAAALNGKVPAVTFDDARQVAVVLRP